MRRLKLELLKVYKERNALYVELNDLHSEEAALRRELWADRQEAVQ